MPKFRPEHWRTLEAIFVAAGFQPIAECFRLERRLTMHLLRPKTFTAQFQDPVVILFRATSRVRLNLFAQRYREFITNADHRFPPLADTLAVLFAFSAQDHHANLGLMGDSRTGIKMG